MRSSSGLRIAKVLGALLGTLTVTAAMAQGVPAPHHRPLFQPWTAPLSPGRWPGDVGLTKQSEMYPQSFGSRVSRPAQPSSKHAVTGLNEQSLPPHLRRKRVSYRTSETPGTIVVDTPDRFLYLVLGQGKAIRYAIGVGREGFAWAGRVRITRKAEWPNWRPPKEMLARDPSLPEFMPGGLDNPLGARALYLGNTLYRIHGTDEPSTIGRFVSSGCIRMLNADVIDLYNRVSVGTRVVVLPSKPQQITSAE